MNEVHTQKSGIFRQMFTRKSVSLFFHHPFCWLLRWLCDSQDRKRDEAGVAICRQLKYFFTKCQSIFLILQTFVISGVFCTRCRSSSTFITRLCFFCVSFIVAKKWPKAVTKVSTAFFSVTLETWIISSFFARSLFVPKMNGNIVDIILATPRHFWLHVWSWRTRIQQWISLPKNCRFDDGILLCFH